MLDGGTSVTLIFYHIGNPLREAGLNLIAAAAQGSSFCHVEISLGESIGQGGAMSNVLRVRTILAPPTKHCNLPYVVRVSLMRDFQRQYGSGAHLSHGQIAFV